MKKRAQEQDFLQHSVYRNRFIQRMQSFLPLCDFTSGQLYFFYLKSKVLISPLAGEYSCLADWCWCSMLLAFIDLCFAQRGTLQILHIGSFTVLGKYDCYILLHEFWQISSFDVTWLSVSWGWRLQVWKWIKSEGVSLEYVRLPDFCSLFIISAWG